MKKDKVVNKIIELRKKYAEKYLNGAVRSGKAFDKVHDQVSEELRQFNQDTKISIDPQIIFASTETFEKYLETGVIREFITIPGLL